MVKDSKAEALENAGQYRRAASRWLEVMTTSNAKEQEWILRRRSACLEKARRPKPERESLGGVGRAATLLQMKMGLSKPKGEAFRMPGYKK